MTAAPRRRARPMCAMHEVALCVCVCACGAPGRLPIWSLPWAWCCLVSIPGPPAASPPTHTHSTRYTRACPVFLVPPLIVHVREKKKGQANCSVDDVPCWDGGRDPGRAVQLAAGRARKNNWNAGPRLYLAQQPLRVEFPPTQRPPARPTSDEASQPHNAADDASRRKKQAQQAEHHDGPVVPQHGLTLAEQAGKARSPNAHAAGAMSASSFGRNTRWRAFNDDARPRRTFRGVRQCTDGGFLGPTAAQRPRASGSTTRTVRGGPA